MTILVEPLRTAMVLMVVAGGGRTSGSMPRGFSGNETVSRPAVYGTSGDGREEKTTMLSTEPAKTCCEGTGGRAAEETGQTRERTTGTHDQSAHRVRTDCTRSRDDRDANPPASPPCTKYSYPRPLPKPPQRHHHRHMSTRHRRFHFLACRATKPGGQITHLFFCRNTSASDHVPRVQFSRHGSQRILNYIIIYLYM